MTVLSKKKVPQGKQDQDSGENSNHSSSAHAANTVQGSDQLFNSAGQHSPSSHRWSPQEFENHDANGRKRTIRASPHRVGRAKRERNQGSPASTCSSSADKKSIEENSENADTSGYNSGDEYDFDPNKEYAESTWLENDRIFAKHMQKKGYDIKEMSRDGACLFRAVADQVYGDQDMHDVVRKLCMDYIERNQDHFSQYMTEDFDLYVSRKRQSFVHGNHIELQALCEIYNRPIEIYCYKTEPINIFHGMNKTDNEPIRLSYERACHYNSIVDPHKATIGVGLGLPGFKPGLADQNLMTDALLKSENFEIEQAMLKDKIFASDIEATNIAIEEQVARASYMEWLRETEKKTKSKSGSSASATVTSASSRPLLSNSPKHSPKAGPSSSYDYDYYCFEGCSNDGGNSSKATHNYYFEGPSTSTCGLPSSSTSTNMSSSPDANRLHNMTLGKASLSDDDLEKLVRKRLRRRTSPTFQNSE